MTPIEIFLTGALVGLGGYVAKVINDTVSSLRSDLAAANKRIDMMLEQGHQEKDAMKDLTEAVQGLALQGKGGP